MRAGKKVRMTVLAAHCAVVAVARLCHGWALENGAGKERTKGEKSRKKKSCSEGEKPTF